MGTNKIHDFDGYELGKPRLYMNTKKINGKPVSLDSIYVSARNYAKANNLTASKKTVASGIKIKFTQLGENK